MCSTVLYDTPVTKVVMKICNCVEGSGKFSLYSAEQREKERGSTVRQGTDNKFLCDSSAVL